MSVNLIGTNSSQSIASVPPQLARPGGGAAQAGGKSPSQVADALKLSPAAQALTQVPSSVSQAMTDILSGQKDVQGDLTQLRSYFQQNPQNLASILGGLQGGPGTYSPSGAVKSNGALESALLGGQGQEALPGTPGDGGNGIDVSTFSLFG